jgi:hypothetical protein
LRVGLRRELMKSILAMALTVLICGASSASTEQEALIQRLGDLMQLAQSPGRARLWVTQSDDLAPLKGVAKSDLTAALGGPVGCESKDAECNAGRTLKFLFAPADRPSGQVLVVRFDTKDRVVSAAWDVTR